MLNRNQTHNDISEINRMIEINHSILQLLEHLVNLTNHGCLKFYISKKIARLIEGEHIIYLNEACKEYEEIVCKVELQKDDISNFRRKFNLLIADKTKPNELKAYILKFYQQTVKPICSSYSISDRIFMKGFSCFGVSSAIDKQVQIKHIQKELRDIEDCLEQLISNTRLMSQR